MCWNGKKKKEREREKENEHRDKGSGVERGRNGERSERVHQQKYKARGRNTGGKENKNQWREGDSHSKAGKLERQEVIRRKRELKTGVYIEDDLT